MSVKQYAEKILINRALQYTGDNLSEFEDLLPNYPMYEMNSCLYIKDTEHYIAPQTAVVNIGEWLIINRYSTRSMTDKEFQDKYIEVE